MPRRFGNTLHLGTPAVYFVFRVRGNRATHVRNITVHRGQNMRRTMTINRRRDAVPFAGAGGIIVNPAARHKSLVNIQARVNDSLAAIRHIFFRCSAVGRTGDFCH